LAYTTTVDGLGDHIHDGCGHRCLIVSYIA
jgi:hypothetical protein